MSQTVKASEAFFAYSIPLKEDSGIKEHLSSNSQQAATQKIRELKKFYRNPWKNMDSKCNDRWHLAEFCLDYLALHKKRGEKRKDKVTEDIEHELNALLLAKSFFLTGTLPASVTSYKEMDWNDRQVKRQSLPAHMRSIERLFCAIAIHDLDEDFPGVTEDKFRSYIRGRIDACPGLSEEDKQRMLLETEVDVQSMRALTFGAKYYDEAGNVIKVKTHQGDRQIYTKNMVKHWPAICAKVLDRFDGLKTRYGRMPDFFNIDQDEDYLTETMQLFLESQPVEDAADRYPALRDYLTATNALLSVAFRFFSAITHHHPTYLTKREINDIRTETGSVTIHRPLKKLSEYVDLSKPEARHIKEALIGMLHNYEYESQRIPNLVPLTYHAREQLAGVIPRIPPAPNAVFKVSAPEQDNIPGNLKNSPIDFAPQT